MVHRGVGLLDQLLGVGAISREGRDAEARGDHHRVVLELHRVSECVEDATRGVGSLLGIREVGEEHRELVSAKARRRVDTAKRVREMTRDGPEQSVAHRVPKRVVHRLEVVEVQEDHTDLLSTPARGLDGLSQAVVEEVSVGESGEHVVRRGVPGLLSCLVQLEDRSVGPLRRVERRRQQPRPGLAHQEETARSRLQCLNREGLVIDITQDHHRYLGRSNPQARQLLQSAFAFAGGRDDEQDGVDPERFEHTHGLGQTLDVRKLERYRAGAGERLSDVISLLGGAAEHEYPHDGIRPISGAHGRSRPLALVRTLLAHRGVPRTVIRLELSGDLPSWAP